MIGRSLVRVSVDSTPGSDPGQVVHTHTHTHAQWGVTTEQLAPVISSRKFTHGAQVNSAFHPFGVDK